MRNRYLAAFQESYNCLGLASAVAVALAATNPVPLLIGLVAEAAYLIFVPDSKWYAAHLARRHDAEVIARREALKQQTLPLLHPQLRERFAKLETMRGEIDTQAGGDAIWMREVLRKLDFLLEKFLQFALKEEQFRAYLKQAREEVEGPRLKGLSPRATVPPRLAPTGQWVTDTVRLVRGAYDNEVVNLQGQLDVETDESTRPILSKRIEVLQRRSEFITKIGKIVSNLNHQLSLLEDTFGLIRDELLARPPEQVLADIEDVVSQTNVMTEVLAELAPYERLLESVGK